MLNEVKPVYDNACDIGDTLPPTSRTCCPIVRHGSPSVGSAKSVIKSHELQCVLHVACRLVWFIPRHVRY